MSPITKGEGVADAVTVWPTIELGSAAEIRGGATPRRDNPAYWNGDIPLVTPTDLPHPGEGIVDVESAKDTITDEGLESCSASILPPGTVLFSSRASIGKVGIAAVSLTTNQGFANLIPGSGLDSRYLAWCLHFHADGIARLAGSTTFREVSKSALKRFRIPLPPLSEQRYIVQILDQADCLRRLRARSDAQAGRVLPALFIRTFGDPATNPLKWPIRRFDMICESRLGKMLDQKQQTGQDPRPYLRNANIHWDRIDLREVLQMDFSDSDREEFRLQRGDVLVCEGGEVGRSAIWNDELPECYFQKALHRVRPHPDVATPEYIVFLLWRLARIGALKDTASKMTFSHLTGVKLKALQVPVPPLELQRQFSRRVQGVKEARDLTELNQDRLKSLFICILHRAFSGKAVALG